MDTVRVPAPVLTRLPVLLIMPESVRLLASETVEVLVSAMALSIVPLLPVTSRVPPDSLSAPAPMLLSPATLSVASVDTVVVPEYVAAPPSCSVPVPPTLRFPVPLVVAVTSINPVPVMTFVVPVNANLPLMSSIEVPFCRKVAPFDVRVPAPVRISPP